MIFIKLQNCVKNKIVIGIIICKVMKSERQLLAISQPENIRRYGRNRKLSDV